jgi:hypothetical protein
LDLRSSKTGVRVAHELSFQLLLPGCVLAEDNRLPRVLSGVIIQQNIRTVKHTGRKIKENQKKKKKKKE